MSHGDMACSNVEDHFGNKERVEAGSSIAFGKIDDFLLEGDEAPDTAGKYDADPVRVHGSLVDTSVQDRLITGCQRNLRITVHFACFLFFKVLQGIEAL